MSAVRVVAPRDLPAGSVIQSKYIEERTEIYTELAANPPVSTSGVLLFSVVLTPVLSTSKILLRGSGGVSLYRTGGGAAGGFICVFAGSTMIVGAYPYGYSDNAWVAWDFDCLHTPGAGATTYKVRCGTLTALQATSIYINGYAFASTDPNLDHEPVTSFTLEEVK